METEGTGPSDHGRGIDIAVLWGRLYRAKENFRATRNAKQFKDRATDRVANTPQKHATSRPSLLLFPFNDLRDGLRCLCTEPRPAKVPGNIHDPAFIEALLSFRRNRDATGFRFGVDRGTAWIVQES
jgi:hypothetical protein